MFIQKIQLVLPGYHPNQLAIRNSLGRFNVLCNGRRWGKDILQRNVAIENLLQGKRHGWYEPVYKDTIENWDWIVSTLRPITKDKSEQERRIETTTGGVIEMWSLEDKDASRGRYYDYVTINEAAKIRHLEYSWNYVIRMILMDTQGSALICSTPRGYDFFHSLFVNGQDEQRDEWRSWQRTSWDNPYLARAELEEAKNTLPEITYRQEIMAEFVTSDGMVFRRVHDAAVLQPIDEPEEGHQYIAGVDVAAAVDYTVVSVMDTASKDMVYMDRFNRVDYPVLEDRLESVYRRFKLTSMTIESNSMGQGVIDHLIRRNMRIIPFTTTSATKQTIIQGLQSAFEHGNIKILDNPVLVGELLSFESRKTPSGNYQFSAPEGQHDDCVMSLAMAYYGLSGVSPRSVIAFAG